MGTSLPSAGAKISHPLSWEKSQRVASMLFMPARTTCNKSRHALSLSKVASIRSRAHDPLSRGIAVIYSRSTHTTRVQFSLYSSKRSTFVAQPHHKGANLRSDDPDYVGVRLYECKFTINFEHAAGSERENSHPSSDRWEKLFL